MSVSSITSFVSVFVVCSVWFFHAVNSVVHNYLFALIKIRFQAVCLGNLFAKKYSPEVEFSRVSTMLSLNDVEPVQSHIILHAAPCIQPFCVPMRLFLMADGTVWQERKEKECCCVGRSQKLHS